MIRYAISRKTLESLIEAEKPGWLARAASRTAGFVSSKVYNEPSSIWSDVKPVYMTLQGNSKCAYCERKLESLKYGAVEQDVDHFRPKGTLAAWKGTLTFQAKNITITATPLPSGYYGLAYDIFNYAASCKPCNSPLKHNHFPIAGSYNFSALSPEKLKSEKPFLIYPIGNFDTDPEDLIGFYGVSPQAVSQRGHSKNRALATIDFFRLDDQIGRANLFLERGRIITGLFHALCLETNGAPGSKDRKKLIASTLSASASHANCARSFVKLYAIAPAEAEVVYNEVIDYIVTKS